MYSSGYSQVNKYSPEAQKRMKSKGKSCGYYMRIVFFFSSLIQTLIIVSLVLFLLYGQKEDTTSTSRIQDLEKSFSQLSIENVALKLQRKNLTNLLNVTLTNKARNDWDLKKCHDLINISSLIIMELDKKLQQCNNEMALCKFTPSFGGGCPNRFVHNDCNCGVLTEQLKARVQLVESNFTHSTQKLRMELEKTASERDENILQVIQLRRERSIQEKELQSYRQKNKDEFSQSLSGVSNVSKAFLQKIDSLFPAHIAFQLTCAKQREHLEQIRTNCTSLSREVEDKLQGYLNIVGNQVSDIQAENNRLKAENWRLSEDYRSCSQNRVVLIREHKQELDRVQAKHDKETEKHLIDKKKLHGDVEVLENNVKFKSKEVDHLKEQIKYLNMSCLSRMGISTSRANVPPQSGFNLLSGGGSSSASSSFSGGVSRTVGSGSSLASSGSSFSRPVSTGTGTLGTSFMSPGSSQNTGSGVNKPLSTSSISSQGSNPSLSSFGSGVNKPASTGTGSSSTSILSQGSSSVGSGVNKPASSGGGLPSFGSTGSNPSLSSSGTGLSRPALSAGGTSNTRSSPGSVGPSPNLNLGGFGLNKPTSSVKSTSGLGSPFGSTGSTSRTGSSNSGLSFLGLGNSNLGQSKTGSGTGKESGTSNSGTGSSFGAGRTNGVAGGTINLAQHLQELQRIINPPGPEEKQDLSRMLG